MSDQFSEYTGLLSVAIPAATFVLGYVVNGLIDAFKNHRSLNNVRKILDYEVNRNIEMLARGLAQISREQSEELYLFNFAKIAARISELMTSTVFDAYISELSKLNEDEIDSYLSVYSSISMLKLHSTELIQYLQIEDRSEKQSQQMLARVQSVTVVAKTLIKKGNGAEQT
ncbi:hypothetical protein [Vibrio vulnificus]|uniref:hypothetical protein n=1 Tax=Vibrio vulnificus TaxID=672 RepID=UPI0028787588|nr:hypothetical protein [Vibrio vulnificus]MDS1873331.1 hypothetical protein [Vibrio vulnificus]